MLAVRLPEDIERRLDALARVTGKTKSHFARKAIVEYLDEIEAAAIPQERGEADHDRFGAFAEWDGAADWRAYHGL